MENEWQRMTELENRRKSERQLREEVRASFDFQSIFFFFFFIERTRNGTFSFAWWHYYTCRAPSSSLRTRRGCRYSSLKTVWFTRAIQTEVNKNQEILTKEIHFRFSEPGANMRHIRKPNPKPIEI